MSNDNPVDIRVGNYVRQIKDLLDLYGRFNKNKHMIEGLRADGVIKSVLFDTNLVFII